MTGIHIGLSQVTNFDTTFESELLRAISGPPYWDHSNNLQTVLTGRTLSHPTNATRHHCPRQQQSRIDMDIDVWRR